MNRRDMVFETCLALFAVTGIVVGNFLVQRWCASSQTTHVADAAAESMTETGRPNIQETLDDEFITPRPISETLSAASSAKRRQRLETYIAEQFPNASAEEKDAWLTQLQDVPFETAVGILDARKQIGSLSGEEAAPLSRIPLEEASPQATDFGIYPLGIDFAR